MINLLLVRVMQFFYWLLTDIILYALGYEIIITPVVSLCKINEWQRQSLSISCSQPKQNIYFLNKCININVYVV